MERNKEIDFQKFLDAQKSTYNRAINEIRNSRKQTHWMWFIFPQIAGLGFSNISKYYAIEDLEQAYNYLKHPVLGARLISISNELLLLKETSANKIFGSPDDIKLRSSMTLFSLVNDADPVFQKVLDKFFSDENDLKTLFLASQTQKLNAQNHKYNR